MITVHILRRNTQWINVYYPLFKQKVFFIYQHTTMSDIVTRLVVVAFLVSLWSLEHSYFCIVCVALCVHTNLNTHISVSRLQVHKQQLCVSTIFMCNNSNAITTKGEQNVERDFLEETETRSTFLGVSSPFIDSCSKLALQNTTTTTTIDFSFYYYSLENCCKL